MLENFTGYEKKNWKNSPDKTTPLSAENLDHMDSGIKMNADAVIALREQSKEQKKKTEDALNAVNTKISNITPDDTAVDGKPWTSKHIVDMLCPPLKVSGNPVQCYPVAGYPLGITASWEPTQEGTGDPSPDNIRSIKGRDAVTVTRCGQNLLEPIWKSKTRNGIQWIVNADGSITIRGTATGREYIKLLNFKTPKSLPDGLYTLTLGTKLPEGSDALMGHYNNANKYIGNLMAIDSGESYASANLNGVGALDCYIECKAGCIIDIVVYPMLVQGDKLPDAYIPYNGDSATLTLPETIYGGTVNAVTGEGAQTHVLTLLTGQENWRKAESGALSAPVPIGKAIRGAYALCSVAPPEYAYSGGGIYTTTDTIIFGDRFGAQYAGVEAWTAYLATQYAAGTPVQVVYKLATPIGFQASDGDTMPALGGINTVLTDADSAEVTGREDLIHAIAGQ